MFRQRLFAFCSTACLWLWDSKWETDGFCDYGASTRQKICTTWLFQRASTDDLQRRYWVRISIDTGSGGCSATETFPRPEAPPALSSLSHVQEFTSLEIASFLAIFQIEWLLGQDDSQ